MKRMLFATSFFFIFLSNAFAQKIPSYSADKLMTRVSGKDTTYIINFWASWCGPCVAELPQFTELKHHYSNQKVRVILVSFDFIENYPDKLLLYVKKKRLEPEVVWFNETNANDFIPKIDNNWSGAIPGTMIINKSKNFRVFLEKPITAKEIEKLVNPILQ